MTSALIAVDNSNQFAVMEALGRQVVPAFYQPYLGTETSQYMMESGHTLAALTEQARQGYRHYLIEKDGQVVGYFALHRKGSTTTLILTHFYLLPQHRGQGLGGEVMRYILEQTAAWPADTIELLTLRANKATVGFYRKHGFVVVEELMTRLANGSELEDYLMRKV